MNLIVKRLLDGWMSQVGLASPDHCYFCHCSPNVYPFGGKSTSFRLCNRLFCLLEWSNWHLAGETVLIWTSEPAQPSPSVHPDKNLDFVSVSSWSLVSSDPSSSKSFLYLSHLKKVMLCLFYPWSRGPTWRSLVWFVRLRFRNLGVQSGCLPACLSLFTQSIGSVCKFSSAFFIPVMLTSKDMGHIILRAHYWKKRFYSMSIRPGIWRGRWIIPSLAHHQTHRVNPLR